VKVAKSVASLPELPYFVFNNFFPESRTVYEIMWKCVVQPERPQKT